MFVESDNALFEKGNLCHVLLQAFVSDENADDCTIYSITWELSHSSSFLFHRCIAWYGIQDSLRENLVQLSLAIGSNSLYVERRVYIFVLSERCTLLLFLVKNSVPDPSFSVILVTESHASTD